MEILEIIYYIAILTALFISLTKFRAFDKAVRVVAVLIIEVNITEAISYATVKFKLYDIRYTVFHLITIIEAFLFTLFYIYALKLNPSKQKQLIILTATLWPLIGLLNVIFLQPLFTLNTNTLVLENFVVISLSLFLIYNTLKTSPITNIFSHTYIKLAVIFLFSAATAFFFWAFIVLLYNEQWKYTALIMDSSQAISAVVYYSIAAVLFLYPKKTTAHEHR